MPIALEHIIGRVMEGFSCDSSREVAIRLFLPGFKAFSIAAVNCVTLSEKIIITLPVYNNYHYMSINP